jgi:serine/threonine protein phosphatase 1
VPLREAGQTDAPYRLYANRHDVHREGDMTASTASLIQRFGPNRLGRDIAVGDVHGHFTRLENTLRAVRFDPSRDRLFSVGDLVDRGPEPLMALDWLRQPWFHAVRGNHEDYAIRYRCVDTENWVMNGGAWFQVLPADQQALIARTFAALPFAMEIDTAAGPVGILHADCPSRDWRELDQALARRSGRDTCIWSRRRITDGDTDPIEGIRALVVGHTPVRAPVTLGNVHYIDTAGWTAAGHFTLLDLSTLAVAVP